MDQDSEDYFIKNFEKKKEMLKNMMNKVKKKKSEYETVRTN